MLWRFLRNSEIKHKIEPVERQGAGAGSAPSGGHRQRAGRAAHGPPPFGHGMSGHLTTGGRMRRWREESNEVKWQWLRRLRTEGGERRDPQRKERMLERIDLGIYRTRKGIYGRRGVRQRQCPVVGACSLLKIRTPRCGGVFRLPLAAKKEGRARSTGFAPKTARAITAQCEGSCCMRLQTAFGQLRGRYKASTVDATISR